jgi:hypothetical protein
MAGKGEGFPLALQIMVPERLGGVEQQGPSRHLLPAGAIATTSIVAWSGFSAAISLMRRRNRPWWNGEAKRRAQARLMEEGLASLPIRGNDSEKLSDASSLSTSPRRR